MGDQDSSHAYNAIPGVPGSARRYSGGGYSVVEQLMIDVAGVPFDVLMEQLVFQPLGMSRSSFLRPVPAAIRARAAMPHDATGAPLASGPYHYPQLAADS